MLNHICNFIASWLVQTKKIDQDEKDLYIYGLELIISNVTAFVIVLIVGMMSGYLKEIVLFLVVFYILRKYGGGYHAKTMLRCMIMTLFVHLFLIYLLMVRFWSHYLWILWILIGIVYILYVPQNEDIPKDEFKKYKFINCLFVLIGMLVFIQDDKDIILIVTYAFLVCSIANLWIGGDKHDQVD